MSTTQEAIQAQLNTLTFEGTEFDFEDSDIVTLNVTAPHFQYRHKIPVVARYGEGAVDFTLEREHHVDLLAEGLASLSAEIARHSGTSLLEVLDGLADALILNPQLQEAALATAGETWEQFDLAASLRSWPAQDRDLHVVTSYRSEQEQACTYLCNGRDTHYLVINDNEWLVHQERYIPEIIPLTTAQAELAIRMAEKMGYEYADFSLHEGIEQYERYTQNQQVLWALAGAYRAPDGPKALVTAYKDEAKAVLREARQGTGNPEADAMVADLIKAAMPKVQSKDQER